MRHNTQKYKMGVKTAHRASLLASLASALFRHDRIETTLGNAKALRPFAEKIITLAKKAAATDDSAAKLHLRRNALSKLRDESAVHFLFVDKVAKFASRNGGYTRIYKLVPRRGDSADMALIELVDDEAAKPADKAPAKEAEKPVADKAPAKKAAAKKAPAKKTAKKAAAKSDAKPADGEKK